VLIFLWSQDFHDKGLEIDLSGPTSFPNDILRVVAPAFEDLFASGTLYRATGVILCKSLSEKVTLSLRDASPSGGSWRF
jgi:hypothetical protein